MKNLFMVFFAAILVASCASKRSYSKLDNETHPSYVHHMEQIISSDLNSEDSATALWSKEFMQGFETAFRAYAPDKKVIEKLKKYKDSIEIKVIGGNWCSDTRREMPRLCKVLYYCGVPVDKLNYYRVDHDKKPTANDFASTYKFGYVPTIVVYRNGREVGKIVEVTRYSMEQDLLNIVAGKP